MNVEIEFVPSKTLQSMSSGKKISFIIGALKKTQNCILVLENPLSREEEKQLIAETMASVSKTFPGIEIASLGEESNDLRAQLIKLLGGKTAGLTVVGNSTVVRQVKRDPNKLRLLAGK